MLLTRLPVAFILFLVHACIPGPLVVSQVIWFFVSVSLPHAWNFLLFPADQGRILGGQAALWAGGKCCWPTMLPWPLPHTCSCDGIGDVSAALKLPFSSWKSRAVSVLQLLPVKSSERINSIPKLLLMVTKRQSLDSSVLPLSLLQNCMALA